MTEAVRVKFFRRRNNFGKQFGGKFCGLKIGKMKRGKIDLLNINLDIDLRFGLNIVEQSIEFRERELHKQFGGEMICE